MQHDFHIIVELFASDKTDSEIDVFVFVFRRSQRSTRKSKI